MSRQKIIITLSLKDQKFLEQLLSMDTAPARTIRRAQILLNSNRKGKKQYTTEELADLLNISKQTVCRVLKEYEVSGIECIYRFTLLIAKFSIRKGNLTKNLKPIT